MKRTIHTFRWLMLLLPFMAAGCVKDDLSDCPPSQASKMLMVRVYDYATGEAITDPSRIQDATFFVFDENKDLMMEANVPGTWLDKPVPILPADYKGSKIYVSTWGNIAVDGWIEPLSYNLGDSLGASFLTLPNLVTGDGYRNCPGEQFFGFTEIPLVSVPGGPPVQQADTVYIDISQVNARLHITVRGLPEDARAEDYYFQIRNQNIGYNFQGEPILDSVMIKEAGVFNERRELVSPEAYFLVHMTDPTKVDRENVMWMNLFQTSAATRAEGDEDKDLTGAVYHDRDGNYLTLARGKTSNVLIEFDDKEPTEFTVQIVVTDWDEVHQWSTWQHQ